LVRQAERLHKQQKKKAEEHKQALEGAAQEVASLNKRVAAGDIKCERLEKLVGEKEAELSESRERIERLEMQVRASLPFRTSLCLVCTVRCRSVPLSISH
jgi:predicted  nucleic acid-binding Zn-ribbon protein